MKKALLKNLVIVLIVLFVAASTAEGAQQKKDFTEENEVRLNRLQPPEKIMDALISTIYTSALDCVRLRATPLFL